MPKGAIAERDVQCRACGTTFRSIRAGKAAFYCHTPACDERRERERLVIPNRNGRHTEDEQRALQEAKEQRAASRRRAAALRDRARRAAQAERARARLERIEPVARARRDTVVELITRIAELEGQPVEMPAWLSGDGKVDLMLAALASDLLAAWAEYAAGRPVPDDDQLADLALRAVRVGSGPAGRKTCIRLAGAALARAQAFQQHERMAA